MAAADGGAGAQPAPLLFVSATWEYSSTESADLNFKADDIIVVTKQQHADWWTVRARLDC
jgi:hypothetical protein